MDLHSIVEPMVGLEFAPLQLAPAATGAILYWLRARKLAARGTPVPAVRQCCWYGGAGPVVGAPGSPPGTPSRKLLLPPQVGHPLLAPLRAPLLLLGVAG